MISGSHTTIYIWPMIRVIGFGAKRPVLVLPDHTPGFADKSNENYVVFFAGSRPKTLMVERPPDANPGTFYSAMSNIDIEIGEKNAGAVGVRGTYAQHCFLAHMVPPQPYSGSPGWPPETRTLPLAGVLLTR